MLLLSHLRLHLVPEQLLRLPAHNKGNSLRGGFGSAFRKLVCVDLRWECATCSLRFTCPYTVVFNPFIPPDALQFSGNQNIPRPFIFKPPLDTRTHYPPGDALVFEMVLVGKAIDYLPYFIVAFRELGATGFGLNRARVLLQRVESIDADGTATAVYEASTNVVRPAAPITMEVVGSRYSVAGTEGMGKERTRSPVDGSRASRTSARTVSDSFDSRGRHLSAAPEPEPANDASLPADDRGPATGDVLTDYRLPGTDYIILDFLTPTTLKSGSTVERDGTLVRHPAFHHAIKRLRDRVNALATFYGDGPLDIDFKALGDAAESVETVDDRTHWVERTRISRGRHPHDLSGFVGSLRVRGDLAPFLPLLRVGEYVHVGKNAVFGNGWFTSRQP